LTDLSSPSPEIRQQAANAVRNGHLYTPTDRTQWDNFVAALKPTDADADVLERLAKVTDDKVALSVNDLKFSGVMTCPLDDWWALKMAVSAGHIARLEIVEQPREIVVPPPSSFIGCWRTYRLDGSPVLHWYDLGHRVSAPGDYGDRHAMPHQTFPTQ
jgi:hypothetical protein